MTTYTIVETDNTYQLHDDSGIVKAEYPKTDDPRDNAVRYHAIYDLARTLERIASPEPCN